MKRTFQGRITIGMMIVFFILLSLTFYFAWQKNVLASPLLVLVIFLLERLLHTSYTVTSSGYLIIQKGRFSKIVHLDIQDIVRIEKGISVYAKTGLYSYLNLILNDGRVISIWPQQEDEFLSYIKKKHEKKKDTVDE